MLILDDLIEEMTKRAREDAALENPRGEVPFASHHEAIAVVYEEFQELEEELKEAKAVLKKYWEKGVRTDLALANWTAIDEMKKTMYRAMHEAAQVLHCLDKANDLVIHQMIERDEKDEL